MHSVITILLAGLLVSEAQEAPDAGVLAEHNPDTLQTASAGKSPYTFKATQLIAPSVLGASAMTIHYVSRDKSLNIKEGSIDDSIRKYFYGDLREGGKKPELHFDNYLQYAPYVLDLGLGMLGAKARHSLLDRTIEMAIGAATCAVLSGASKYIFFESARPNYVPGAAKDSFPSGHTDTAFLGAELVRIEYGYGWGAGAYAMGITVGTMRLYNNWHWFSDVLYGAAIGILSANVGAWLLEPIKNLFNIPTVPWDGLSSAKKTKLSVYPSVDPQSGAYMASFSLNF